MCFICKLQKDVFHIYILISVNEVVFTMTYKFFVTHTSLLILGAHSFMYLTDVLGTQ